MKKFVFCAIVLCAFSTLKVTGQTIEEFPVAPATDENGWSMTVGFDNMTAYNWRGLRQSYHAFGYNIMPSIEFNYTSKNFGFNIGLYDFEEVRKTFDADGFANRYAELGAYASVSLYGVKLEAQAYGLDKSLWNKNLVEYHGGPVFDLGLSYTLGVLDWFQPSFSWYTIMAGDDKDEYRAGREGKQAFSSYLQLDLPFYVGDFTIEAVAGCNPFYSPYYCNFENQFMMSNLGLKVDYTLAFDNGIEIPLSINGGYNFGHKFYPEEINSLVYGWYFGATISFYFTHEFQRSK